MPGLDAVADDTGVTLKVLVRPRSSQSKVVGLHDDALAVAVKAPPVDGAANDELVRTLARHFGVVRSAVRIVGGQQGRRKRVHVDGLRLDDPRLGVR
jgi:uncharacterized protein (TIGR00251 family)